MKLSSFAAYIKQLWRNKPDTSTPVSAERLAHMEEGIKGNSDAIEEIAAAVVSQIVNDPDKIASMAALYAVNQKVSALDGKVGDTAQLPDGATDVVTAIAKQNSDLTGNYITKANGYKKLSGISDTKKFDPNVLGCCFLNGSTANLPTSYDSTYIALANGFSMCIPYFENEFVGMYVRTYNGQWFPWQKII